MDHGAGTEHYFPVSPRKFITLSLLTWGIYEIYWFYKNWAFIRSRDRSDILPWGRALFAPLWYPALLGDLREHQPEHAPPLGSIIAPAGAYLALVASGRLPDPFWLLTFFTFVPLLAGVRRINAITPEVSAHYARNSRWRHWHVLLALVSVPSLSFIAASTLNLIPSTQVTPGWMLWGPSRSFLDRSGILEPGEEVAYYYSNGLWSFADDGNLVTDRRVVSYYTDPDSGELLVDSASFSEIREKTVERGDLTELTITRHDGTGFMLLLSNEEKRDELFIRHLDRMRQPDR